MSSRTPLAIFAVGTALATAVSAHASPAVTSSYSDDQLSVRVSVADLDLHKDADAAAAVHRVRRAAAVICGNEPQSSGLARYIRYRACVTSTAGEAVASVGGGTMSQFAAETPAHGSVLAANDQNTHD